MWFVMNWAGGASRLLCLPSPIGRGWCEAPGEGLGRRQDLCGPKRANSASTQTSHPLFGHLLPVGEGWARPFRVCFRPLFLVSPVAVVLALLSTPASAAPRSEQELVAEVRAAIAAQDYGAFEKLVFWQGSSPRNTRSVAMQIRHGLGRPVKSVTLEPASPEVEKEVTVVPGGQPYQLNLPVTHTLHIVYADGEGQPGQGEPGAVFLIGKSDGEYRIALVVKKP